MRCIGPGMKACFRYSILSEYKFTVVVLVLSWRPSESFVVIRIRKCLVNITIVQVIIGRRGGRSKGHVTVSRVAYRFVPAVAVFIQVGFVVVSW